jgi:hypothetical protein
MKIFSIFQKTWHLSHSVSSGSVSGFSPRLSKGFLIFYAPLSLDPEDNSKLLTRPLY